MKRQRHTPEEIIKKLREAATLLAGGQSVEAVCKKLEVSPPTYHRWRQEYGGAKEETVKRLKALEKKTRSSRNWWPIRLWTSRSARRWRRENGRPGAQTSGCAACAQGLEVSERRAGTTIRQRRRRAREQGADDLSKPAPPARGRRFLRHQS